MILIVMGGLMALFALLMTLPLLVVVFMDEMPQELPRSSMFMVVATMLGMGALGIANIWLGIGSIQARRWARALIVVSAWLWLLGGLSSIASMAMVPDPTTFAATGAEAPPFALSTVMRGVQLAMLLIYLVVPAAFIAFYVRQDVRRTCELRDPVMRWTDRCPLPVLAVSIVAVTWGLGLVLFGLTGWLSALFGVEMGRAAATALTAAAAALFAGIAWGAYRLKMLAWWGAVAVVLLWGIAMGTIHAGGGYLRLMERFGADPAYLEAARHAAPAPWIPFLMLGASTVVSLLYLLYVRRYFAAAPGSQRSVA